MGKKCQLVWLDRELPFVRGMSIINKKIKNVVDVRCPIIAINQLYKGETCGYNRTFRRKKSMHTATIPMGYADGFGLNAK